jgi:cargo-transport protein YPP1
LLISTQILYRAATKSYHSTQILRYLFTVHAYVAEFDLAFRAFDSYVEIVQRGRDRAEKTGEIDFSLDDDETILNTAADSIKILCRFGSRKDAEKAKDVCKRVRHWLEEHISRMTERAMSPTGSDSYFGYPVPPRTISVAYHALGLNEANWSRLTFEPGARSTFQNKAIEHFRTALEVRWGNSNDLDILFSWALTLAEMRDVPGAIKVVKRALAQTATKPDISPTYLNAVVPDDPEETKSTQFPRERKLIAFWHLLALLLTAKSDPNMASKSCDAAFEQFHDPENLFGPAKEYRSEHLNEKEKLDERPRKSLVDLMGSSEKDGIVQVKITQLSLVEVLEGPAAAVDSSADLLALYARLFGDPRSDTVQKPPPTSLKPPKSAVGTLRNSLFSRARSRSRRRPESEKAALSIEAPPASPLTRPSTRATVTTNAPTIQVTDEDGSMKRHVNGHQRKSHVSSPEPDGKLERSPRPTTGRRHSSKLRKRSESIRRRSDDSSRPETSLTANDPIPISDATANGTDTRPGEDLRSIASPPRPSTAATSERLSTSHRPSTSSPDQPLRKVPHNLPRGEEPPPPGHADQPPQQDIRLPAPHPASAIATPQPRFPSLQERRHKISLLVEVWVFISGLYTRASLFDDARGAYEEAFDLVQILENEVAKESSSAKAFEQKGWGAGKTVEELWADVWTQVSLIWTSIKQ